MRANRLGQRAAMAMAATGILTALAPATAALADDEAKTNNAKSMDLGVTTIIGDQVVSGAYTELQSDHALETPMGSNCNYYSPRFNGGCRAWSADFVKYVWKNVGVYGYGYLDHEPASTVRYGKLYGSWHPGTLAGIYPGASVVYNRTGDPSVHSDHVGIYVGVIQQQPWVISGDFNNQVYKHPLNSYRAPIAGWTGVG
jgi:hypothetical protein